MRYSGRPKVLIYRPGQLGDTVVALPALWAVRDRLPEAEIVLLSEKVRGRDRVLAIELLEGSPIIDRFMTYDVAPTSGSLWKVGVFLSLAKRLRRESFDVLIYLAPSLRGKRQVLRDRAFFLATGVRHIVGTHVLPKLKPRGQDGLPRSPHEADLLMKRLALSGWKVPAPGKGCMSLGLTDIDRSAVDAWAAGLSSDGGRRWIAVGPGSRMPLKVWPEERYAEVVQSLVDEFEVWPVVFGGPEDKAIGDRLLARWGRGYNACGRLGPRRDAAALERCSLYLGNDTGTMHLAAAAGTRCVAIFSARDNPGKWSPYGRRHHVLRNKMACEGCRQSTCERHDMACVVGIGVAEVLRECRLAFHGIASHLAEEPADVMSKTSP